MHAGDGEGNLMFHGIHSPPVEKELPRALEGLDWKGGRLGKQWTFHQSSILPRFDGFLAATLGAQVTLFPGIHWLR